MGAEMSREASPPLPRDGLREARKNRGWSQQELAELLGITHLTVSRWERGLTRPGPHFRQQLSTLFEMSPQALNLTSRRRSDPRAKATAEKGAQQEPMEQPEAIQRGYWLVPQRRNPFFVGRQALLSQVHQQLAPGRSAGGLPLAISGLGGVGKTQSALEYAYRFRGEYPAVFWLRAETQETLSTDLLTLAQLLPRLMPDEQEPGRVIQAVLGWLRTHPGWLLILDNVKLSVWSRSSLRSPSRGLCC